jgi:hypothetical protein
MFGRSRQTELRVPGVRDRAIAAVSTQASESAASRWPFVASKKKALDGKTERNTVVSGKI